MAVDQLGKYNDDGTSFGLDSSEKISLWGATPAVQRGDASQAAFTDSAGGTVSDTLAAGVGKTFISIYVVLAQLANGEVLSVLTPGFKGKILSLDFFAEIAVTTGSKASTLNLEIGTTDVEGGALALTSANCTPKGVKVAGAAVTGDNTFSATDTLSLEAASTTTFIEGTGWVVIGLQNMDVADAISSIADKYNELRTMLVAFGLMKGSA